MGFITQQQTVAVMLEEGRGIVPHSMLGMGLGGSRQGWRIEGSDSEGTYYKAGDTNFLWLIYSVLSITYGGDFHLTAVVPRFTEERIAS